MKSNFSFQLSFSIYFLSSSFISLWAFIFLRFLELEMHLRGYFSLSQSDSRIQFYFKFVIILAPNLSRLSLVDFFGASTCDDESPLEVRENSERKCPPLKPTVALFSLVTLFLATGNMALIMLSRLWFTKCVGSQSTLFVRMKNL